MPSISTCMGIVVGLAKPGPSAVGFESRPSAARVRLAGVVLAMPNVGLATRTWSGTQTTQKWIKCPLTGVKKMSTDS